jgi:GNAT superfamily N-acetyltransferase
MEHDQVRARDYLGGRSLQLGHILPVSDTLLKEYFPAGRSFLVVTGRAVEAVDAVLSYNSGRDKWAPTISFRVVTDSLSGLKEAVGLVEEIAVAEEKLIVRTRVFGYDKKRLQALKALGYNIGASLQGTVALDGRRYDLHVLFKDLSTRYKPEIRRSYAKPGLYAPIDVEKAKTPKLKVRGYKREDRPILDKLVSHQNVIRGIGSGIFPGLYPFAAGDYQQRVDSQEIFPVVCEDELVGEPVGSADLWKMSADVMQHTMGTGIFVRADYQGLGVGTILMESVKTMAMRLHLSRVWLSLWEGNTPAEKLYRKVGFEVSGKVPGCLQEGYVNELFMTLKLD